MRTHTEQAERTDRRLEAMLMLAQNREEAITRLQERHRNDLTMRVHENLIFPSHVNNLPHLRMFAGATSQYLLPIPNDSYTGPPRLAMAEGTSHAYELGDYLMLINEGYPTIFIISDLGGSVVLRFSDTPETVAFFDRVVAIVERARDPGDPEDENQPEDQEN
jgi:hypothetical protein